MSRNKGVILLCTLAVMTVISIFLMAAVWRTQNSILMTKRVTQEIKAYWSAKAGIVFAAASVVNNVEWPFRTSTQQGGGFRVTFDNNVVKGEDEESGGAFSIFVKSRLASSSASSSLELCPYARMLNRIDESYPPEKEAYILSVGSCGSSVCGLEIIYGVDQNIEEISTSAAVYAGGNINAFVDDKVYILQTSGTRPSIISGNGTIIINGTGNLGKENDGPLVMGEGIVFLNNSGKLSLTGSSSSVTLYPSYTASNLVKYGLNVYPVSGIKKPEVTMPSRPADALKIPSGTYCYVEMPESYTLNEFQSVLNNLRYYPIEDFVEYYDKAKTINGYTYGSGSDVLNTQMSVVKCNGEDIQASDTYNYDPQTMFDKFFNDMKNSFNDALGKRGDEEKNKIIDQYKFYLTDKVNNTVTSYSANSEVGNKKYEPFFIPPGVANTDKENKSLSLTFKQITEARIFADIVDSLERAEERMENSGSGLLGLLKKLVAYFEVSNIRNRIEEQVKAAGDDEYVAEKIYYSETEDGKFFTVLKPKKEYNKHYKDEFSFDALRKLNFTVNDQELGLKLSSSFYTEDSDNYFNFATYERGVTIYKTAEKRRGFVDLGLSANGAEKGIYSDNINIKGIISGNGQLVAERGDVSIEAGSALNAGEENWVAIYARNDIKLSKISAEAGNVTSLEDMSSGHTSDFSVIIKNMLEQYLLSKGLITGKIDFSNKKHLDIIAGLDSAAISNIYFQKDNSGDYYLNKLRGFDVPAGALEDKNNESGDYVTKFNEMMDPSQEPLLRGSYNKVREQIKCWGSGEKYIVASNFRGLIYGNNLYLDGCGNASAESDGSYSTTQVKPSFALEGTIICSGDINIVNYYSVVIKYNPELSSIIFSQSPNWDSAMSLLERSIRDAGGVNNEGKFKAFNRI